MKEMDWRAAALRDTNLTAGDKVVMMALLMRADWQTWQGVASVNDLAELTAMSDRGVKNSLKRLTEQGWISRTAQRRDNGLHHKAAFTLLSSKLGGGSEQSSQYGEQSSQRVVNKVPNGSEQSSQGVVNKVPRGGEFCAPNINSYQLNDQLIDQQIDQPSDQPAEPQVEPSPTREGALEAERRDALQAGCRLIAPTEDMGSLFFYRQKIDEVARFKGRMDIRLALSAHDAILAEQAHKLRIAPASIVTYVEHLANTQRAPQSLIRR